LGRRQLLRLMLGTRINPVANVDTAAKPQHLLMALFLLKKTVGDEVGEQIFDCHRQTYAKWAWIFIEELHDLHVHVLVSMVDCCC
jgi:hypothetical protein